MGGIQAKVCVGNAGQMDVDEASKHGTEKCLENLEAMSWTAHDCNVPDESTPIHSGLEDHDMVEKQMYLGDDR